MRLRDISISALLAIGLLAPAQAAGAAGAATEPGQPAVTTVPETVSARLDGFAPAAGFRAASAEAAALSGPAEAPIEFSMVGLELPVEASARLRTSTDGVTWGEWRQTDHMESDDGPDRGSDEAEGVRRSEEFTEPLWVDEARWIQVEVDGAPLADVAATFIDSKGLSDEAGEITVEQPAAYSAAAAGKPAITTRAGWGANESLRKGGASYASKVRYAVVHHTAGGNSYSAAEGPAVVRGIYHYHTQSLGWSDVGYNVLVDKYGRIYEGRAGGLDRAVVGAHAQGFNTGSVGVSVMGNFDAVAPPEAALNAVADVLAWKLSTNGLAARGKVSVTSGGSNKFPSGRAVTLNNIAAHRDVGLTACPGAAFFGLMENLRERVTWKIAAGGGAGPVPDPQPVAGFHDIAGNVHAGNIAKLVERKVTAGCEAGRFCPHSDISRGEAAALLVKAMPHLKLATGQKYADVPETHMFAPHIFMATEAGMIGGYPDGTFRPSEPISREQLASVLGKAAKLSRKPGQYFNDVPWTSPHLAWVNALGQAGISHGCGGGSYCPAKHLTRAEMATFIVNGLF